MFSIEIRINSQLVTHIYGYNTSVIDEESGCTVYNANVYKPEKGEARDITVLHNRSNGIDALVWKIMKEFVNTERHRAEQRKP